LCLAQTECADIVPGNLAAIYLPLDSAKEIAGVPHPDVAISAAALIEGVGGELSRLREGAALPALGEGEACAHCDARGLCRRDQWAAGSAPSLGAPSGP
jgi:ATP-dependent helicase/nuclease subunit B